MDEIVVAAMRKWPGVPHCYGWLGLDARGDWYLRDAACQAAGEFPRSKGSRIEHAGLRRFIERNYLRQDDGCWAFQNGPQRVYVELEAAPWVWRVDGETFTLAASGGEATMARGVWLDERGRLFVDTALGFGLVHSLDMEGAARAVECGRWAPREMPFAAMPGRFGYVLRPSAMQR